MRVAVVNMQRNEDHCLDPWIRYHGYLFGYENLFILDHASDSPRTLGTLSWFEAGGVSVVRLPKEANYRDKGQFVANEVHRIEALADFDFVFPVDCDEFLFLNDPSRGPLCERSAIFAYLEQFRGFPGLLEIKENFLHVLGHPGYFWSQPYQKVFFTGGNCLTLDHGSHVGTARSSDESRTTRLAYAHFHFKPYRIDRELSREKLRPWVDVDDEGAVRAFDGPGAHLKHHLLCTEQEYYAGFRLNDAAIYFDDMVRLFRLLGIDPNFSAIDSDGSVFKPLDPVPVRAPRTFEGRVVRGPDGLENIALGKAATQSSISAWSHVRSPTNDAAGGIDGRPDGNFGFHTDFEESPWWMLDLGSPATIREVRLFNRLDDEGIARRAARLVIEVGFRANGLSEVFRRETDELFGGVDGNPLIFRPNIPIPGRYVRIRLLTQNYLHLDQVEVYGDPLPEMLNTAFAGEVGA